MNEDNAPWFIGAFILLLLVFSITFYKTTELKYKYTYECSIPATTKEEGNVS